MSSTRRSRTLLKRIAAIAAVLILVAGTILGAGLLAERTRAAARRQDKADAVPAQRVEVRPAEQRTGYQRTRAFVGRVAPARSTMAAFDRGGLVLALSADDGDTVAAGEVIGRLDTARLDARMGELESALSAARSRLALADSTLQRTRRADRAVSTQALDEAERAVQVAQAEVARNTAAVASLEVELDKSVLTAPFDAIVAARRIDEGKVVAPGEPVYELLDRNRPEARIGFTSAGVTGLPPGAKRTVRVGGEEISGRVKAILPVRGRRARTVEVVFELDTRLDGIRVGDQATVTVPLETEQRGFSLPLGVLTEGVRGLWACYVAVPLEDSPGRGQATHRAERRDLELYHHDTERAYVAGNLQPGELVIVSGTHRLTPDLMVRTEALR